MRVVLDTNVLVSGVFFGGVPGRILSGWATGKVSLVLSPAILTEYRRVGRALGVRHPEAGAAFLAAALASHTRLIVSGDKDLLRVSGWRGITVLTPRRFLDQHLPGR